MDFTSYIEPGLLILAPALYILGEVVKKSEALKNKHIPLFLIGWGVILASAWIMATSALADWQDFLLASFTGATQGILAAGVAVLGNQLIKQHGKDE